MSLSYDVVARLLARQLLGGTSDDQIAAAKEAMDLSLLKLQQRTRLISQQKEKQFTSTGAGTYTISASPIQITNLFRIAKIYTADNPVDVMAKERFVSLHPDFEADNTGLVRVAVLWGDDSLLLWRDQSGTVINIMYYELIDETKADRALDALYDIATKYLDPKSETRGVNAQIAEQAVRDAGRANKRAQDQPLQFLNDERVVNVNAYKRMRRRRV